MSKCYTVIVAGGSGMRFGSALPKQFVVLGDRPVLMHTIGRFAQYYACCDIEGEIILVLPEAHFALWQELCERYEFTASHRVVAGGDTRFGSVLNALNAINSDDDDAVVAIHDGVRPLVSQEVIAQAFATAQITGSAIPVIPVADSMRMTDGEGYSHSLERARLRAVQTPQAFRLLLLKKAYELPYNDRLTDDASVYEQLGLQVTLIDGIPSNIKITNAGDLPMALLFMKGEN